MYRLAFIIISAFVLLGSPALAKDTRAAMWMVSQLSGDARVLHNGLQPASLKVNERLAPGDIVATGATGRATLTRGADYIVLAPRSELRLPATPQPNGFTRVIQNLGTMLFKIRHTGVPHFAVDTPLLAAVVKGTTFTVVVDKDRSAVQVIEGAVEVAATDGGMKRLVQGGRTVFIDHSNPKTLIDADTHSPDATGTSSNAVKISGSATPSLTAIANLTEGLVRPATTPQPTPVPPAPILALTAPTPVVTDPVPDILDPVTDPIVDVVDPVTDPIVDVVDPVTAPIADVVDPVTDPIADLVEPVTAPIADLVEPVTAPIADLVEPVTEPIADLVEPVTAPIADLVEPVTEPIADLVEPVTAPIADLVEPVTEPIADLVEPVTAPIVDVVEPVTDPIIDIVDTTVPVVTDPILDVIDTTLPIVTEPAPTLPGLGL